MIWLSRVKDLCERYAMLHDKGPTRLGISPDILTDLSREVGVYKNGGLRICEHSFGEEKLGDQILLDTLMGMKIERIHDMVGLVVNGG